MSKRQNETTSEPELSAFRNERIFPGCDDPEVGQAFPRAIAAVRKDLGKSCPLYIGGKEVATDEFIDSVNPVDPDEVFGPVLAVMRARDFDQAIEWANSTRFALTGGVFSRNREHLERCRSQFRVGNLYLNRSCVGAMVKIQPFGGFKMSGVGTKAGGPDYLLHFMDPRSVTEQP